VTNGSVERHLEVGDARLRVIVEGAIVATERSGAEHALDWAEADIASKARVVDRDVVVESLYVHTDEHERTSAVWHALLELYHEEVGLRLDQRHRRGGAPEGPPAMGEHRRTRDILDGKARDDVPKERVGEEAEAVEDACGAGDGFAEARRVPGRVVGLGASSCGAWTRFVGGDGLPDVELLQGADAKLLNGISQLPQR
jgi:hypothetical protein